MCLGIPAKITQILPENGALVNLGGIIKEISIALVDNVSVGDYVIIHVGYALTKLNQDEAEKTLKLFAEMQDLA